MLNIGLPACTKVELWDMTVCILNRLLTTKLEPEPEPLTSHTGVSELHRSPLLYPLCQPRPDPLRSHTWVSQILNSPLLYPL